MSDVKRYDLEQPDSHMGSAKMQREDYGDWVSFEDYTALRARLEAVEKERYDAVASYERLKRIDNGIPQFHRAERAEAALATARRDALIEVANMKPTREQIANAAMGYDHSFGLMTPATQENLMHRAGWWLNAWQHVIRALANEAET